MRKCLMALGTAGDVPPGVVPLAMLEFEPSVVQQAGAF